jgi:hypothetical protein
MWRAPDRINLIPALQGRRAGLTALVATLVISQPCSAQKLYSYEPLMMDPYATIYVDDGSCSAGKVLKVQGVPKNHRRKKSCVPLSDVAGGMPSRSPK